MPLIQNEKYLEDMNQINNWFENLENQLLIKIKQVIEKHEDIIIIEEQLWNIMITFLHDLKNALKNEGILQKVDLINKDFTLELVTNQKEIDPETDKTFTKFQDWQQHFELLFKFFDNDIQPKENGKSIINNIIIKLLKSYNENENLVNLIIKQIKFFEEKLHNDITNIIKNGSNIGFIHGSAVVEVNQFIQKLKQQFKIIAFEDLKAEDKLNFPVLNDFYQKYVENSKNLVDYNYYSKAIEDANTDYIHERLKIIQAYISSSKSTLTKDNFLEEDDKNQYISEEDKIKLQNLKAKRDDLIENKSEEMHKIEDNARIFLNKEILSKKNKEKLAKKLEKELKSLSKDELKTIILKYFEEIKEEFFDIFNEKLNNFKNNTKEINFNYKNRLKELNQRQDINLTDEQKNQLIKTENRLMVSKRIEAFNDFEKKISFLFPKLDDFTTHGYHELQVFRNQLLINKDISPEIKKQYQEISSNETFIKFKVEIETNLNDINAIAENVDTLHEHVLTLKIENEQKKTSKALITGIIQKQDYFVTKNSGKKLDKKIVKKILFLEDHLSVNKKLKNISRAVNEWDTAINKLSNIKKEIKKQKLYKNLTTDSKNKVVSKNGILEFKPFLDDNANYRAQFIIGAEFRKTKIAEYLVCFNMKKHTFEDTIGKFIKLEKKKKSIWDKIFSSINWLKQIKVSYHKLRQSLNPKLYFKNDINAIKKSKKKLYIQCDAIKIKYARLMAVPLEQRSIFSINKTDNYYLMQAKAEIEKTISQFANQNKEKIKFYERWAEKQVSDYDSNKRTMQKIKTILDDFTKNPIKDDNNNDSKYQFKNIKELNTVLEDRVKQLDYKPSEINENMKAIIECANGLSDYVVAQFKDENTFFPTHT